MESYIDHYPAALGRLHSNLLSLEMLLRVFLVDRAPVELQLPRCINLLALKPGDRLPENPITDWSSLRQLITKYNALVETALQVSASLADIRDAFAHGRVLSADSDASDLHLIRFKKPSHGTVVVEAVDVLTRPRLSGLIRESHAALLRVREALGA
jgi:hypothetical protein